MDTIELHHGELQFTTHYYGAELEQAPLVLCLHGFPDNASSFRFQVDDLVDAGYRVLVPTMRGFETSSIPANNDFSLASIAGDVIAWLDELQLEKVHLVGHDWGSAVAYISAGFTPARFLSMTTIAVPHPTRFSSEGMKNVPGQALKSWYILFNQIPGLSDYFTRRNDFAYIRFLWRKWSPGQVLSESEWADLRRTFAQPGVVKAMLEYYRQSVSLPQLLGFKRDASASLTEILVPNLAITGADDGCIDTRVFDHAIMPQDFPKGVRLERIEGAGHFTHQEQPAVVNKLLIDWFREHDAVEGG